MAEAARNTTEEELRALHAVVDATRLLVLTVDENGSVQSANRAFERATDFGRERWRRPIWELAALPNERALLRAAFSPLREQELPHALLFHLRTARAWRVVDWDVSVIHDERRAPTVVLAGLDQTERQEAEQQLRASDALQRVILDRLPAVVWSTDTELRITFGAGGGLSALGLAMNQLATLGTSMYAYLHTNDSTHPVIAAHLRALTGELAPYELRWMDRLYHGRVEPLRDAQSRVVGCIGIALDVTDQVGAAKALEESEARLQRLMDADVIGIAFWDAGGRLTEANHAFLSLLGFSRDDLRQRAPSWQELTPPEYRAADERAGAEMDATGKCAPYEKEYIAKSGEPVPVLIGAARIDHGKDGSRASVAFVLDQREQIRLRASRDRLLIEEQRARLETELANARLLLLVAGSKQLSRSMRVEEVLSALADVVVPALADWSCVVHRGAGDEPLIACAHGDPNKRELLHRLHGFVPDPNAPEGPARVFRSGEPALYADIGAEQLAPSGPGFSLVGTRDPEPLHLIREIGMRSLLCVPVRDRGRVDAVLMLVSANDPRRYDRQDVVLAQDLADRAAVSLEKARLLSEAIESVRARDDFLAVAAHELRTPLTSLVLQIQMLERTLAADRPEVDAARRGVSAAEKQARRLSLLIDRLLDVARLAGNRLAIHVEEFDLAAMLRDVVSAYAPELQRAGCSPRLAAPERAVGRWDRLRIEQVLTNLLANARKFGEGRPIEVTLDATPTRVRIGIRDHGIGVSREDQARIFGRFERAVSVRHFGGLGLGLYISVQIVRAHGGSLRIESSPGAGSLFIIDLPRTPELAMNVDRRAPAGVQAPPPPLSRN
jgi:PAS domain S-box-containing protein